MDHPERALLGGAGIVAGLALVFVGGLMGLLLLIQAWVAGGTAPVPSSYLVSLWMPLVQEEAARYGVPTALDLGLIAHESAGNWLAERQDPNGTVDAGLQQVNSSHWAATGLSQDPYAPGANVTAGLRLLAAAVSGHPGDLDAALEAYNGYGTGYAAAVLAQVDAFEAGPQVFAWPVESRVARGLFGLMGGGQYRAAASAGPGMAYVLVTALCPCGQPYASEGRIWTPILTPQQITLVDQQSDSAPGPPEAMASSASAPDGLRLITPPESGYFWAAVPISPSTATQVTVTATWRYTEVQDGRRQMITRTARTSLTMRQGGA